MLIRNLVKTTDDSSYGARADRSIQSGRVLVTNTVDRTSILDVGMVNALGQPVYMLDVPFSPQNPPHSQDTVAIMRTNSSPYSMVIGGGAQVGGANSGQVVDNGSSGSIYVEVSGGTEIGPKSIINVIPVNMSATAALNGTDIDLTLTAKKRGCTISLCNGFTPAGTGADVVEIPVPYDPADGTTSITWNVRRITLRVNVAGGAPVAVVQKSTVGNAVFGAGSTVGTLTMGSGDYLVSVTSSLGTVASGNFLRFNVTTLGTATGWTITVELGE